MAESISAVCDLSLIHFEGGDAARFLQGYLTCDTLALRAGRWSPGAFCDLKGRVVANGWVAPVEGGVDCIVHAGLAGPLLEFLKIYLRFSKTRARIDETRAFDVSIDGDETAVLQFAASKLAPAASTRFIDALNRHHLVLVTPATSGRFLPHALGLVEAGAVAFDKGCYLGQEIVARAHHRGTVKKHLVRLLLPAAGEVPLLADVMTTDRQKIGSVVQIGLLDALMVANLTIGPDTACLVGETRVTTANS